MNGMRRRWRTLISCAAAGLALGGVAFAATNDPIQAAPACCAYAAQSFSIDAGTVATFNNDGSDATHDVAASLKGPDRKPLFSSAQIRSGSTRVDGTQYLPPGSYRFFCTIHGASVMNANLKILPGGTPKARPRVDLIISQQSLDKVVSSGKLAVLVKGKVSASDVTVKVSKGKTRLGTLAKLTFAAGTSRTIRVPLTKSAKKALAGLSTATLAAEATVPFGSPDRTTRTLR